MNVKANLYLSKNLKNKIKFFVPLSPADETNVFGGNYYLIEKFFLKKRIPLNKIEPLKNIYLGNEYKIKKFHFNKLKNFKINEYSPKIVSEKIQKRVVRCMLVHGFQRSPPNPFVGESRPTNSHDAMLKRP